MIKTLVYGGDDKLIFESLKKILEISCSIHSIDGLYGDFSNHKLVKENFLKVPKLSKESQKNYQQFYLNNFTTFNQMIVRRGLFLSSFHDLRDEFSLFYHSFFDILKNKNIELIIFFSFPHEGPDYILYKIAKLLKIKTLLFYQSIFKDRYFMISDISEFGKLKNNFEIKNFDYLIDEDLKYIKNISHYNKQLSILNNSFKNKFLNSRRKFKFITESILTYLKIINRKDYQAEYIKNLEKIEISNESLDKILKSKKKKIYFPFHFQPELLTSFLGGNFDDQVLVLERLSIFAGDKMEIIAKDNPRQIYYQRGEYFFKRLKYLKNVHFVNRFHDSADLIEKTDITVTLSGTAGWEAIKNKKKCLLFGSSWYSDIHGVLKIKNETTDEDINKFLEEDFDYSKFKSDFNNILSQTYEGIIFQNYKKLNELKNFDKYQNAKNVAKDVLKFLSDK